MVNRFGAPIKNKRRIFFGRRLGPTATEKIRPSQDRQLYMAMA